MGTGLRVHSTRSAKIANGFGKNHPTWVPAESKPKGLPAVWLSGYHALVPKMYDGWLFGMDKTNRVMAVKVPGGEWVDYRTPAALEAFLGIAGGKAPKVTAVRVAAVAKPAPVAPEVRREIRRIEHADMPGWVVDWLDRLVHEPKREYCAAWAAHRLTGADAPADPGTEWADKARRRFETLEARELVSA